MELQHETIEKKARHFVRWNPTTEMRLFQLNEMASWFAHFNPESKVKDMIPNASRLFAALEQENTKYLVQRGLKETRVLEAESRG